MRNIVYLVIFVLGLIYTIVERVKFEKKKSDKSVDYIDLFRQNNTLMIVIFFAISIDKLFALLEIDI